MHKSINFNLPHDGTRDYFIRRKDVFFFWGGGVRGIQLVMNLTAMHLHASCLEFGKHSVHFLYSFFLREVAGLGGFLLTFT